MDVRHRAWLHTKTPAVRRGTAGVYSPLQGVNVAVGSATVTIDPVQTPSDRLVKALAAVGFTAEEIAALGNVPHAR